MGEHVHEYIGGPRQWPLTCFHCNHTKAEIERDEFKDQVAKLLAACEAARNWTGLDGDGIDQPVLGQLIAAIASVKSDA